jgi:hypothetical protein
MYYGLPNHFAKGHSYGTPNTYSTKVVGYGGQHKCDFNVEYIHGQWSGKASLHS